MEGDNMDMAGNGVTSGNPRWNPTKEQISMLESFYNQGIRTPSANQIQQITSRLKAYGHIEGKNVFYWFQNHKARQRQKQKQENMAYINRYLHRTQPALYPPPGPNVVCGPYFIPQGDLQLYHPHQYPKVLLPGSFKRKARASTSDAKMEKTKNCGGFEYDVVQKDYSNMLHMSEGDRRNSNDNGDNGHNETLPLFPLHPTGILEGMTGVSAIGSTSAGNFTTTSSYEATGLDDEGSVDPPFFDFFSCQGS
ncbi:hypothetical protein SLEP1_g19822 [Rubroshorea leprosula]|uniref:Homeobox domain-containing protein n=1 Tax=Rubroshorea leprosula TaxID=152421 RepID=A0AAV5J9H7_9ROSI|nr:hypothetical protein SLEP1_g19822 [Rubroshorea leprosula]